MITGNDVQAAVVAYCKTKTDLVNLLDNGGQIKERQWQGDEFLYPAVRVSVDFYPAINGCQPRSTIHVQVFSEQKSSDEASTIAGVIQNFLHRHPFTSNNIKFFSVIVQQVSRPERSVFAWESKIAVETLLT
jgi:hypothetical protein